MDLGYYLKLVFLAEFDHIINMGLITTEELGGYFQSIESLLFVELQSVFP